MNIKLMDDKSFFHYCLITLEDGELDEETKERLESMGMLHWFLPDEELS